MADTIDQLQIEITSKSENASAGLEKLTETLSRIKSIAKGGIGLTAVKNQLNSLSEVVNKINISKGKLQEVVDSLSPLQNIQKSNLGSALSQLKKIPDVINELEKADLTKFGQQVKALVDCIKPLATEMEKVSAGFSHLPSNIQKAINANAKLTQTVNTLNERKKSLMQTVKDFGIQIMYVVRVVERVMSFVGELFSSTSDFVEATNLFTVAMGNGAQAAYEYGEAIQEILGINLQDWITSLGTFNQMFLGFGIENSEATQMSQLLTQVAYDISSLFNVDVSEPLDKLQSGVAGMVKGMRDYGVELTVAAIQETAYAHGINKSVSAMSVSEKVQLRVLTIMEKTKNMQGDLARTLVTPANALRILENKWEILKRTLGEIVSIIAVKVIPIFSALVNVVTDAAERMSAVLGYEMPTIDYSSLEGLTLGAEDLENGLDSASEAAKALKQNVAGFDELNIISPNTSASDSGSDDFNIDWSKYEYDFLGNITQNTAELEDKLRSVLDLVVNIGLAVAGWSLANALSPVTASLSANVIAQIATIKSYLASALVLAIEFILVFKGMQEIISGEGTWKSYLEMAIGAGLGTAYLWTKWGAKGVTIGIAAAVTAMVTAIGFETSKGGLTVDQYAFNSLLITALSTGLGAFVAVSLGLATGGVGALIGLTAGVIISVISVSVGMAKDAENAYLESQMRKDIFGDLLDDKGYIQLAVDMNVKIGNMTADITDIEDKFSGIKEIIDRIFELNALPEKTTTDMTELQTLVETINGMQLGDLKVQYDNLSGSVLSTKEEIYGVIKALEKQALATAYQEILVETYKEQITVTRELKNAKDDLIKLEGIETEAQTNLNAIQKKINEELAASGISNTDLYAAMTKRLTLEIKYAAETQKNTNIMKEAREKIEETKGSITELTKVEESLVGIIDESILNLGEYSLSLDTVTTDTETLGDTTDIVVKSIKDKLDELRNTDPIIIQIRHDIEERINTIHTNDGLKGGTTVTTSEYASGGYVPKGDIFIANEKGPELVSTLNGKTAVANQDQMVNVAVRGVTEALKNINVRGGNEGSGEVTVKVYMDGKQILTATEKAKRERGASLLPAGVVNYG